MEILLVGVSAVVVFEVARQKLDAWAVQRAEQIAKREKAQRIANQEAQKQLAALKQKLTLGAVAAGAAVLAIAYLRYRLRGGLFAASASRQPPLLKSQ